MSCPSEFVCDGASRGQLPLGWYLTGSSSSSTPEHYAPRPTRNPSKIAGSGGPGDQAKRLGTPANLQDLLHDQVSSFLRPTS